MTIARINHQTQKQTRQLVRWITESFVIWSRSINFSSDDHHRVYKKSRKIIYTHATQYIIFNIRVFLRLCGSMHMDLIFLCGDSN